MEKYSRYVLLTAGLALSYTACSQPSPEPFQYLNVTTMSDGEREELMNVYIPRLVAAFDGGKAMPGEPIAVVPVGSTKQTMPGPVLWEIQMPVVDYATGISYVARLAADRVHFVLEPLDGPAPLASSEAQLSNATADADPTIASIISAAKADGYKVEQGVMLLEPSDACPDRCVDVRYIGFGNPEIGLKAATSVVFAQVSLASHKVVGFTEYAWKGESL